MNSYCILKTKPLGDLLLLANSTHLLGLYFADCEPAPIPADATVDPHHRVLKMARKQVEEYLAGRRKEFTIPLDYRGTPFQHAVWRRIAAIPFGKTITYGELADRAGNPKAVRAAGSATGRNPIAVIIPCHRIVGTHGTLCGFGGGLERKERLLELEGIATRGNRHAPATTDRITPA